uniref:Uncharacterized protein n=1 Tax=Branchiostoma floridae TaxID=7739 RepID=C3ZYG6_BRAFL|eukprot:XP_002586407.1 hypothetical protein BRAFLDRAFT_108375 [Branchiostoma floridae]
MCDTDTCVGLKQANKEDLQTGATSVLLGIATVSRKSPGRRHLSATAIINQKAGVRVYAIPEDLKLLSSYISYKALHPASPLTRRQTCGNGADPVRQYAVSNPAGCEYLVFCDVDHSNGDYNECPRRHVLDQFFMACLCCPEHSTREQCIYCVNLE